MQIETWEQEHAQPFVVNGQKFVEYVTEQWEMHRLEKERAKQERVREPSSGRGGGGPGSSHSPSAHGSSRCRGLAPGFRPRPVPDLFSSWDLTPVASDCHTATEEQETDGDGDALRQCSPHTQQAARTGAHHAGQSAQGKRQALGRCWRGARAGGRLAFCRAGGERAWLHFCVESA